MTIETRPKHYVELTLYRDGDIRMALNEDGAESVTILTPEKAKEIGEMLLRLASH